MNDSPIPMVDLPEEAKQVMRQITALYIEQFKSVLAEAGIDASVTCLATQTDFRVEIDDASLVPEDKERLPDLIHEALRRVAAMNFTPIPERLH